jgi:beta-phosphoglucomutase-like phosphatase (HAD superfamily)
VSHGLGNAGLRELERDLQAEWAVGRLTPEEHAGRRLRELGAPLWAAPPGSLAGHPGRWMLSYEVGLVKPDPAIFRLVCDRLELQPAETLFVGDTPSQCAGASHNREARHADLGLREALALSRSPATLSAAAIG